MFAFCRAAISGWWMILASVGCLWAHDPGLSNAVVQIQPDAVLVKLTFAPSDLGKAAHDPSQLSALAARAFLWQQDGKPVPPLSATACTQDADTAMILTYPRRPATFRFQLFPELPFGHRQFLSIQSGGKTHRERIISAASEPEILAGPDFQEDAASRAEPVPGTVGGFFRLGVQHIVTGYDHLLFLLGLLVVCQSLTPALICISCFTVAHSVTLAASVLGWFSLPAPVVEPLIAASILYIGLENFFRFQLGRRAVLTFLFGLIHGMGFAGILQDLGIAQRPEGVLAPLLGFNLGVEAGQIAIALVVLPLLLALQRNARFRLQGVPALSMLVALAGAFWLVERALL